MGIESKHSYRFVYLKSEKWDSVRLEALVRDGAKCFVCGFESISNDAHHLCYPKSFWDTTPDDLIILCRACHNFMHKLESLNIVKFKDSKFSSASRVSEICMAIKSWRMECVWIELGRQSEAASFAENAEQNITTYTRCFVCEKRRVEVSKRQFSNTTASPQGVGSKFCDECFDYLDGKLKLSGFDISTAPKVHIAIRKTLKTYPLPIKPC